MEEPRAGVGSRETRDNITCLCLISLVVKQQFCKLKTGGSNLSLGIREFIQVAKGG